MEQDRPLIIFTLTDLESVPGRSRKRIELINRAMGFNASATARKCGFRKQAVPIQQAERPDARSNWRSVAVYTS